MKKKALSSKSTSSDPSALRDAALREVAAIYAELALRPIERDCQRRTECCHFRRTGLTPYVTAGEALYLARAVRAAGKTRCEESSEGACPVWDASTGRCRAYEGRPFGCRTHFCRPAGGPWERDRVVDLIRRLETLDALLAGEGPRPLPAALSLALQKWPTKKSGLRNARKSG